MFNACDIHRDRRPAARRNVMLKKILGVYEAPRPHWVGNGFPVRSLFSYGDHGKALSPFLLLDHAGPQTSRPPRHGAAWARIRTAASRP
jgi:hypothetical protein